MTRRAYAKIFAVAIGRALQKLGYSPNLMLQLNKPELAKRCAEAFNTHQQWLRDELKISKLSQHVHVVNQKFLIFVYRHQNFHPGLIYELDNYIRDCKKCAKRRSDEDEFDFGTGTRLARIIYETENTQYFHKTIEKMKTSESWPIEYTDLLISILLFQNMNGLPLFLTGPWMNCIKPTKLKLMVSCTIRHRSWTIKRVKPMVLPALLLEILTCTRSL